MHRVADYIIEQKHLKVLVRCDEVIVLKGKRELIRGRADTKHAYYICFTPNTMMMNYDNLSSEDRGDKFYGCELYHLYGENALCESLIETIDNQLSICTD